MPLLSLYVITGLLFFAPHGAAASADVEGAWKTFLSQDLKQSPDMGALSSRLESLRSEPADEVRRIVPLALSWLRSENANHQEIGTLTLVAITLRQDSADLLGASIPELVTLLERHDRTHSGTALGFLVLLNPRPPASLVPYLLARLADGKASTERLSALSRTLLRAAPDDPAVTGAILNLRQEHPAMKADVVQMMGAAHTVKERALTFLGASLAEDETDVRLMAAQAIEGQAVEIIQRYRPQLARIAPDANEQPAIRESASRALARVQ